MWTIAHRRHAGTVVLASTWCTITSACASFRTRAVIATPSWIRAPPTSAATEPSALRRATI